MRNSRENTGRFRSFQYAAGMTAALIILLILVFFGYERRRTLHAALGKMDGAPLSFSAQSGFYEEGFDLKLIADEKIPHDNNIVIRYTLNGDEPTADSPVYNAETGIDLREAVRQAQEQEKAAQKERAEVIRAAEEKLAAEKLAAEKAAAEAAQQQAATETNTENTEENTNTSQEVAPQEASSQDSSQASSPQEETVPTIEEGRQSWQEEIWAAASDAGVRTERTEDGIYVIPVRACLIQGEDRSDVVTRTYVIGPEVKKRYDVYVASVVTDSYNLFDYDKGIMVAGSHYQKDVDKGVREDRAGNYFQEGDEWIKNGHVTLFNSDGEVLLEEDAGFSISGYSSRSLPTRSFRAEASKMYGTSDDYFHLDIFSDGVTGLVNMKNDQEASGETGQKAVSLTDPDAFRKVKFRSHGIPGYHIRSVRNQYARILTDECGFPGLAQNRLGIMFLNGQFYTVCDVTPSADTDYLCTLFGLNVRDAMEKYSGSDVDVYNKSKIYKLFTADLTVPENQERLEQAVDMDNYLFYFALEVLFNNADWPYNNVTIWRYLGEEDPANPYTDGRIRFVLEDMDQILTNDLHGDPTRWSTELVDYLMKDKGHTFHHVMDCKRYRDTFLTYVDDLLKTAFEPDHACAILDELYGEMKREYILDYGEAFWQEMEDTAEITKRNVREKESLYRANITEYMGLTERYPVRIETGEGVCVTWNNMTVDSGQVWENEYYCGTSFTVTAEPTPGYRFTGWEVNGKIASEDPSLEISDALLDDSGGTQTVRIRAMAEATE